MCINIRNELPSFILDLKSGIYFHFQRCKRKKDLSNLRNKERKYEEISGEGKNKVEKQKQKY